MTHILSLAIVTVFVPFSSFAGEQEVLRGYGKVAASITPRRSEFGCESEEKAGILLGKLLADMFWDAAHQQKTVNIQGKNIVIHVCPPYGAISVMRAKNRVIAVGGDSEQAVVDALKNEPAIRESVEFTPSKPYPMYLDFYDLRAFKAYTLGLHPENKYNSDARMEFVKKFFPGGMFGDITKLRSTPGEGVDQGSSVYDTDIALCEKNNMMYSINIGVGVWPLWLWNKYPQFVEQDSDISPLDRSVNYWANNPESYGIAPEQRRESSLKFLKNIMLRYKDRDVVGGWQLFGGNYFYESYFMKGDSDHLGYSALGQAAFRQWLNRSRGFSLKDLGTRWHGDPAHFKDWSEVILPASIDIFFGGLNDKCLRINSNWFWKKADAGQAEMPPENAAGWIPVEETPSRLMFTLPDGSAFWRVNFDPGKWLAQNTGKDIYLVCDINNFAWKKYQVWLNGKPLGTFGSTVNPLRGPFAIKVTGLLSSGVNRLGLSVPGGYIHGPVFLTTTPPQAYPYLGKQQNARYVDMLEWQLSALNALQVGTMEYARSIDPDRPFVVSATEDQVKDGQGEGLTRFGGSMQDTGYDADDRQRNSRFGYAGGFYGSCEAAGIPNIEEPATYVKQITRMLGWVLINGEGSHMFWRDPHCYFNVEKQTGWFTKNKRLLQLVGKCLPEKPDIAVFHSSQSALLDPHEFHGSGEWDIGRGDLPASHYDCVYVTEGMIARGLADDYPVLFDTDSRIMAQGTIDAIRKHVEKGGTFIALQNSGRHSILEPDSWPISALTGFKVQEAAKSGKICFAKSLPVFKGWEKKEFESDGIALDPNPIATGTMPLARWQDGAVAVGMRKLGKGRVIVLGSSFWRQNTEFCERLFTSLGVKRTATASDRGIYARKMITKNGQQEWLIAMNQTPAEIKAGLGFAVSEKPSEVLDMVENTPVAFDYAEGWVKIKDAVMPAYGTRIFGVKRDSLAGGIAFWWFEKTKFWTRRADVPPLVETAKGDKAKLPTLPFEAWKFFADKSGAIGKTNDWAKESFNDTAWRKMDNTPWNFKYDDLKNYDGTGLYRSQPFTIPWAWKGRKITLDMTGYLFFCFKGADFFINGKKIEGFPNPNQKHDITDSLKSDGNVLSIKLTGTASLSGLLWCAVWLQPEIELNPRLSLLGEWQAVMGDWGTRKPVALPGEVKAKYLVKEVVIPAEWNGKNVYLQFSRLPFGSGIIVINGHPEMMIHPTETAVNLTPYVQFGGRNTIIVWPNSPSQETNVKFDATDIGCEVK